MKYIESLEYLKLNSLSYFECKTEKEFKEKYDNSNSVYLIKWKKGEVFNWGTMGPNSNRVRKSSVLNNFLTGKYDRRVDYLMFHKIFGLEIVYIFKFNSRDDSRFHEKTIRLSKNQRHCFSGIEGNNRDEISINIYSIFKQTEWYNQFDVKLKNQFDEFFYEVFLGNLKHPRRNVSFKHGDVLEPKFLRTIGREYLEPVIEQVLDVKYRYNL